MFLFVVDTDQPSIGFVNQMAAYMTGQVGISGVGKAEADLFHKECKLFSWKDPKHPFTNRFCHQVNHLGLRVAALPYITTNCFHNSVGGYFCKDDPDCEQKAVDHRNAYWQAEADKWQRMLQDDKSRKARGLNLETCKEQHASCIAKTKEPLYQLYSFQSVSIMFVTELSEDQVNLLRSRATKFSIYWKKKCKTEIEVTGARIIKKTEILVEELKW